MPIFIHQDAHGEQRLASQRSSLLLSGLCASASLVLSVAHAQGSNDVVLEGWASQTGERVEVGRSADGAVTWRAAASVDGYRREVETPGDASLLTPNSSGDYHQATISGEWRSKRSGERESHLQIVNTNSSDRAVLSRHEN